MANMWEDGYCRMIRQKVLPEIASSHSSTLTIFLQGQVHLLRKTGHPLMLPFVKSKLLIKVVLLINGSLVAFICPCILYACKICSCYSLFQTYSYVQCNGCVFMSDVHRGYFAYILTFIQHFFHLSIFPSTLRTSNPISVFSLFLFNYQELH